MKLILRNNKYFATHTDDQDTSMYGDKYELVMIDNSINLQQAYANNGFDIKNLLELPDPRKHNILSPKQLQLVKKATASFYRKVAERKGITWGEYRFNTDTETCKNLSVALGGMQTGKIKTPTISWRDADGKFVDLNMEQLDEVMEIVMSATEANFEAERAKIGT